MTQSRRMSFFESVANMVVGFGVAMGTQLLIFPLLGINIPLSSNVIIVIIFSVVSIIRSYVLRRFFNLLHSRA